jgi:hypothetical protein
VERELLYKKTLFIKDTEEGCLQNFIRNEI